jgi:Domain of unknown function (DUF4158)
VEHNRTAPELSEWWRLSDAELALLETKPLQTRLGFTAQLIMYRQTGRFVERIDAFPSGIIDQLAALTETAPADLDDYPWSGRTGGAIALTFSGSLAFADRRGRTSNTPRRL